MVDGDPERFKMKSGQTTPLKHPWGYILLLLLETMHARYIFSIRSVAPLHINAFFLLERRAKLERTKK
jgi:hypothetical protein